ncbi:hypothetical protein [Rossellomorea arthrocnemi]|uniref:hypothetical protein n=1 Tax=Rossellomorea arthrocnemi TaxID=2769542 RepID=UPI0019194DB5|nr:hypothetical protein [Rossellomorea arthrocnemi]
MESYIENSFLTKHFNKLIVKLVVLLGVDLLFSLLAVTFFVPREKFLVSYLPIVSLVTICFFSCIIIFVRWKRVNQFILYALLFVMLVLGIYTFSASWWLLSLLLLFLHWRFVSHFQSEDSDIDINSGAVLAFILVSIVSLLFGSRNDLGNATIIYCLLFMLVVFITIGTAVQRMMNQADSESKIYRQFLRPFAILLVVIIGGGLLVFFIPFLRTGFYWGVQKFFWAISFLADPVFNLLLRIRDWIMSLISRDTLEGVGLKLETADIESAQQNAFYEGISMPWIKWVLIGIFLLIFIMYVLKKRRVTLDTSDEEGSSPLLTTFKSDYKEEGKQHNIAAYSDASNTIRKKMKNLEREASLANTGRNFNENVRTWFMRMNIFEEEHFFVLYERVRYGMKDPSLEEVEYFTRRIELHIAELKNRIDQ